MDVAYTIMWSDIRIIYGRGFYNMKSKKNRTIKTRKQEKKQAIKQKKKVATTLDWSELDEIRDKKMILKHGRKNYYAKGVKLTPINIFILDPQKQAMLINNLRIVLNQITIPLYWAYVFTPVNIDMYFAKLQDNMRQEENPKIKSLMQSHYEKGCWFCDTHKEISFEFFIRAEDEKTLYKDFDKMVQEFTSGGFRLKEMNDQDYADYIAYLYENDMINDYYLSRGIFSCLVDDLYQPEQGIEYRPEFDLLENEESDENVE